MKEGRHHLYSLEDTFPCRQQLCLTCSFSWKEEWWGSIPWASGVAARNKTGNTLKVGSGGMGETMNFKLLRLSNCPTLRHLPLCTQPQVGTGATCPPQRLLATDSDFNGNLETFLYSIVLLLPLDFFYFFSSAMCCTSLPGAKPAGSSWPTLILRDFTAATLAHFRWVQNQVSKLCDFIMDRCKDIQN